MKLTYKTLEHTFRCSEITVAQYKDLLKSIFGDEIVLEEFLDNFLETFSCISNKPVEFFQNLNWYELFSLLLQLRMYTLGETCQVIVTNKVDDKENKRTIHLNLKQINEELLINLQTYFPQILTKDNIEVMLFPPTIQRDSETMYEKDWFKYIFSCTVSNKSTKQTLKTTNHTLTQDVVERLPTSLASQIMEYASTSISALSEVNFLEGYDGCENATLSFSPTREKFLWFCKLFFGESLDIFYSNLFYLSKLGSMDLNYIEKCTPGELIVFVNKLQEYIKEQGSNQTDDPSHDNVRESISGL